MGLAIINYTEWLKGPTPLTVVLEGSPPKLKKRQGTQVKRYRKELQRKNIKFTEYLLINAHIDYPNQMLVVFTW